MTFNPNFDNLGQFTGQKKIFQVRHFQLNGFTINTKKEPDDFRLFNLKKVKILMIPWT